MGARTSLAVNLSCIVADLTTPLSVSLLSYSGPCARKKYATGPMERTAAAPRHDTRKVKPYRVTMILL